MSTKRVSYTKLLKEALSAEWDTTKTVDAKGPMLDPILGYDGGGELETHKDAASILERYYFKEEVQEGLVEAVENELDEDPQKKAIAATKSDIADEVDAGETGSLTEQEEKEEEEEEEKEEEVEEGNTIVGTENAIIEKLISEMEEEDAETDEEAEEVEEGKAVVEQEEEEEEEEKELDVDKEVDEEEKEEIEEVAGAGAGPLPAMAAKSGMGDGIQRDDVEEAFNIFREQIEEETEEDDEEVDDEEVEEKVEIKTGKKVKV